MKALRNVLVALAILGGCMLLLEWRLAERGFNPTVSDSAARWSHERERAATLGGKALVLTGASRIQLGVSLEILRSGTGLEPVQLAIDGGSAAPVLASLAADPRFRGTVLVDFYETMFDKQSVRIASRYVDAYQNEKEKDVSLPRRLAGVGARSEDFLAALFRDHMRSFADGATPLFALQRAFGNGAQQGYQVMAPDRSRRADYSRLEMPRGYYVRTIVTLGEKLDPQDPHIAEILRSRIDALQVADGAAFLEKARSITSQIRSIRERGGDVVFVKMPVSGMVRDIETRRYPAEQFYRPFLAQEGVRGLPVAGDTTWSSFECPDGSHLDQRDRERFTASLVTAFNLLRHDAASK